MIEISVSKAKACLSEVLARVAYGHERVVILSRGKPKAAIISAGDLERLEEWEEEQEAKLLASEIEGAPRFYSVQEVETELAAQEPDDGV